MRRLKVALGARSYPILIGRHLLARVGFECARQRLGTRCAVITDTHVGPLYGPAVVNSLRDAGFDPVEVTVPAGERAKALRTVAACYDRLAAHRLERRSFVVALGGGVVGDLAGFVAATYLRGLGFVQVPTTLLAQVDSSVGGKVGVNLKAGKNLVGAFWQPRLVVCDLDSLRTLPAREFKSGLAEVIKYGIISDARLFGRLERDLERVLALEAGVLEAVIARCCQIKAQVVAQDETETGLRAILNFGHTIGHALEAVCGYGHYLHGEAIAIGQVLAARLSVEDSGLPPEDAFRIAALLARAGLPTRFQPRAGTTDKLIAAMRLDKKVRNGEIRFVLARGIGEVVHGRAVPPDRVRSILDQGVSAGVVSGPACPALPALPLPSRRVTSHARRQRNARP